MTETVTDILAGRRQPKDQPRTDLQKGLGKLRKIDRLLDRLLAAAKPEDDPVHYNDWENIYDAIFSSDPDDIKLKTHAALARAGFRFPDYCDPDTSYEADVRAWVAAFKEVLERVEAQAREESVA